jgi:hypothetical protein
MIEPMRQPLRGHSLPFQVSANSRHPGIKPVSIKRETARDALAKMRDLKANGMTNIKVVGVFHGHEKSYSADDLLRLMNEAK